MYTVGIITASDKGSTGEREDKGGKIIKDYVEASGYKVERHVVLPDDMEMLQKEMAYMADELRVNLILTTGGTGFSKRDVTPEATKNIIEREASGISEAIRYYSLKITPRAMLSRGISGIRGGSIIVNLPGNPKAVIEALEFILDSLKHGIEILTGEASDCAERFNR